MEWLYHWLIDNWRVKLPFVVTLAILVSAGIILLNISHASTPVITLEPEAGAITSPAQKITDNTASGGASVVFSGTTTTVSPASRDLYQWPFSWDSIWNLPISSTAQYVPAGLSDSPTENYNRGIGYDPEEISVDPTFPIKTLSSHNGGQHQVHTNPNMTANGSWNNCATFLGIDKQTIYQGQPLSLTKGGNPSYPEEWSPVNLKSPGTLGCHGGSSLSGLGGDLRSGEMLSSGPLHHALKMELDCYTFCSRTNNGFRWPAIVADGGYNIPGNLNYYNGNNPSLHQGSLLALTPTTDLSFIKSAHARKIAEALRNYGAYVVDNTAWRNVNSFAIEYGSQNEVADSNCLPLPQSGTANGCTFYTDILKVIKLLQVVDNNAPTTPGGGTIGTSRLAPYAPSFTDGSGGPPAI